MPCFRANGEWFAFSAWLTAQRLPFSRADGSAFAFLPRSIGSAYAFFPGLTAQALPFSDLYLSLMPVEMSTYPSYRNPLCIHARLGPEGSREVPVLIKHLFFMPAWTPHMGPGRFEIYHVGLRGGGRCAKLLLMGLSKYYSGAPSEGRESPQIILVAPRARTYSFWACK